MSNPATGDASAEKPAVGIWSIQIGALARGGRRVLHLAVTGATVAIAVAGFQTDFAFNIPDTDASATALARKWSLPQRQTAFNL